MRQFKIRNRVYNWLNFKQHITISCLLCRADTTADKPLCGLCIDSLPIASNACYCCGLPMLESFSQVCANCLKKPPAFDRCISAFQYDFPVNFLIQKIKHQRQIVFLPPLVKQLSKILIHSYDDEPWPETIIPVPLHNQRLRVRGFDQSLLLARKLHTGINENSVLSLESRLVKRQKYTDSQQGLTAKRRKTNLKNAFIISKSFSFRHVAIVDDVVTTGATVSEIALLLKKQGAERVDVWCLARTAVLQN
ncbi:amidophosphoribosyltransferase [Endozoicomonas sp. OPT23]|uniref:ComF family protein n=1 Tax=Endozoicomonas sp. OPT23 TaxID=2072845 RepID=UPI00129B489B|nr:phosphoribosyltransferase family protein [Endozoicomonas sp. OPT23]MRI31712.1 amidophosphoribosyltransferase [Endozoicomonas sp. OPT23]